MKQSDINNYNIFVLRKYLFVAGFILIILALVIDVPPISAQVGDGWSLISEVNALRAAYGLAPYRVDGSLMSAAQLQSEWQAKLGTWTHSGPGGSRPHDRAVAAGYGGGAQVFISENVAMGINLSPHKVVYEMWQDALHLETMVSTRYKDIGAGSAVSGGYVFYTIDVGVVAGGYVPPATQSPYTPIAVQPIKVATPKPDGSIIHVVGEGQTPWGIALAYKIPLPDLLRMNNLTEKSLIFPGDKLTIKQGATPTETLPIVLTFTQTVLVKPVTPTGIMKLTTLTPQSVTAISVPSPNSVQNASDNIESGSSSSTLEKREGTGDLLLIAVSILGGLGLAMILVSSALKRTP